MDKKTKDLVDAFVREAKNPNGSYTGITNDGYGPVQDADDL